MRRLLTVLAAIWVVAWWASWIRGRRRKGLEHARPADTPPTV